MLRHLVAFLHQPRTIAYLVIGTVVVAPPLIWAIIAPDVPAPLRIASWVVTPVLMLGYAAAIVCSIRLTSRTRPINARSPRS
ncbi:hypothetical protein [Streptomyces sp. MN6]